MNFAQASRLVAAGDELFSTYSLSGRVRWFEHPTLGEDVSAIAVLPNGGIVVDCEVYDYPTACEMTCDPGALGVVYSAIYPEDDAEAQKAREEVVRESHPGLSLRLEARAAIIAEVEQA